MAAPQRKPADVLKAAREAKVTEWFEGRRWRVMDEADGQREVPGSPGITATYRAGHFKIEGPGKFQTPLGHSGKNGILVAEIDAVGQDTGKYAAFGATALKQAQERFGLIVGI